MFVAWLALAAKMGLSGENYWDERFVPLRKDACMTSRWFNVAVVGFWLTTMGWLIHDKVLLPWSLVTPDISHPGR